MKQTGPLLDVRGRATGGSHFFALTIPVKLVHLHQEDAHLHRMYRRKVTKEEESNLNDLRLRGIALA